MGREIPIQGADVGYVADVDLAEGVGVIEGASANSVKLPTADGQRIVGVVLYAVSAGEKVTLRQAGHTKMASTGVIAKGDELIVTATTGAFKTADTTIGERHHIAAIAEEANASTDTFAYGRLVNEPKMIPGVVVAAADPTADDDGYDVGQLWMNSTDGGLFACKDNTADTAVWGVVTVTYS